MCETGRIGLKLGRFGGFIGCSNYPECKFTRQLSVGADGNGGGMRKLGEDPETGLEVTVRSGRFGSYLQLGEATKDADGEAVKPKRASLPKGVSPDDIDLDRALKLLALPRDIGKHPDDGEDDHRRRRPLRALREARQDLRQPRRRATTSSPSGSTARSR